MTKTIKILSVLLALFTAAAAEAQPATKTEADSVRTRTTLILGTNAVLDAIAAPNMEAGIRTGGRTSLHISYIFPWFKTPDNRNAQQVQHAGLTLKYWPVRKPGHEFTGWWLSAGAGAGYYDLRHDGKGKQGEFVEASLGAGYSFRLSGRWRLTLGAAFGPALTRMRNYETKYEDKYLIWQGNDGKAYFGPLVAELGIHYAFSKKTEKK